MMPKGMPHTVPMRTATVDCQATNPASWLWVNPSALINASSRLLRRTEATRVRPRAVTAPAASAAPRMAGVPPIDR
jgi:hypothetical protein